MGASVAFEVKTVISVRMALYRIREATSGSYSPFTGSLSRISGPRHKARSLSLSLSLFLKPRHRPIVQIVIIFYFCVCLLERVCGAVLALKPNPRARLTNQVADFQRHMPRILPGWQAFSKVSAAVTS